LVWKTINGNAVDIDLSNSARVDPTRRQTSNLPSNKQNHQVPSILEKFRENRIHAQARKDQKKDEVLKEKKLEQNLTKEWKEHDEKVKAIQKEFKKGRIDSGEAQKRMNKITSTNKTEKQILPSGQINLTKDGIKLKNKTEKELADKNNQIEKISQEVTFEGKTNTFADNITNDKTEKERQEKLRKLREEKLGLEYDLLKLTGTNPLTKYNKDAMTPSIETRKNEKPSSPGRATEADEALGLPKEITDRRTQASQAYYEGITGEEVPTFGTIPYQTKRLDYGTGEYSSRLSDSRREKQIENLKDNPNIYEDDQQADPTIQEEKGMGALRILLAERAGRSN
jgi:hypothetical protein